MYLYDEAEPLYRQTLVLREKALGKEHPDTLSSMNSLAILLESQGKQSKMTRDECSERVYSLALLFSPVHCLTQELFKDEEPDWITTKPAMEADWGACTRRAKGFKFD